MRIAAGESLDELTCGLWVALPVDDDGPDEVGGLVDVLADDDGLCAGVAEVVDLAAFVGAGLVQLGRGSARVRGGSAGSALEELELVLALGEVEAVVVWVPLGLTDGLGLTDELGLTDGLGLTLGLGLTDGLGLTLGLGLTDGLGLDDVAGAVGLLLAELVLFTA